MVAEPIAVDYQCAHAHHLNRRVYVTFNTLVQERELDEALETLALIHDLTADGVIVQDMGIARLARTHFPQLRLHAPASPSAAYAACLREIRLVSRPRSRAGSQSAPRQACVWLARLR